MDFNTLDEGTTQLINKKHLEKPNPLAPIAVEIPRFWAWIATNSGK